MSKKLRASQASFRKKPKTAAVELVRARLADQVDLVGAEPVFGGIGRGLLLEFLNGIDRQHRRRSAEGRVDIGRPVDHEVVGCRPGSHDADGVADPLPHAALLASDFNRSGAEEQQLEKVAAVERQVRDLLFGDDVADRRRLRVDGGRVGRHFHPLGNIAGLELEVHALNLVHVELDVRENRQLEPRLLGGDDVCASRQERHDIGAVVASRCFARESGLRVGNDDFDLRHDAAARVLHRPKNLAGGGLGAGCTRQQEHRHDRSDDPIRCSHD